MCLEYTLAALQAAALESETAVVDPAECAPRLLHRDPPETVTLLADINTLAEDIGESGLALALGRF